MKVRDLAERFWSKVIRGGPDDCWNWRAGKVRHYGTIRVEGKLLRAHRLAYEMLVGSIPAGFEIDHICRNRACVNPAHLEVVTHRENLLRGESFSAQNAQKTHCPRGHRYAGQNLYLIPNGGRDCRACKTERTREWREREREA